MVLLERQVTTAGGAGGGGSGAIYIGTGVGGGGGGLGTFMEHLQKTPIIREV